MPSEKIIAKKENGIGWLILNNPERHNAISLEMWTAAMEAMQEFAADPAVRVMVMTGAGGKAFASGADISKFKDERQEAAAVAHYQATTQKAYDALLAMPVPTIAMIRGYCIGGGLGLAVCCDLRICTEGSRFALPAAKLGVGYAYAGIRRFIDVVGPAFTKEIFFTARQFDAAEAREMGLVNRVLPDAELEPYVKGYAETIADNAPLTVNAVKFIVSEALKDESRRDIARCAEMVQRCWASNDYHEGRKAFLEKRKPAFTGT
jgi:enoyl-CoA hydratase